MVAWGGRHNNERADQCGRVGASNKPYDAISGQHRTAPCIPMPLSGNATRKERRGDGGGQITIIESDPNTTELFVLLLRVVGSGSPSVRMGSVGR